MDFKELTELIKHDDATYANFIEKLEKDVVDLQTRKEASEIAIKKLKELKYKIGEPIVHFNYGVGLIVYPVVVEIVKLYSNTYYFPSNFIKDGYLCIFVKTEYGSTKIIKEVVEELELMPYNTASKTLYHKDHGN